MKMGTFTRESCQNGDFMRNSCNNDYFYEKGFQNGSFYTKKSRVRKKRLNVYTPDSGRGHLISPLRVRNNPEELLGRPGARHLINFCVLRRRPRILIEGA